MMGVMDNFKILVINPGSTSTKVAIFENEELRQEKTLEHSREELAQYRQVADQYEMRRSALLSWLAELGEAPESFHAYACRGASFGKMKGGAYLVDEVLNQIAEDPPSNHAGFLAARIGYELSVKYHVPAYIYDAVTTDEFDDIARYSGTPLIQRLPAVHTLNTKAVARQVAKDIGKTYETSRMIVAHLGGGCSTSVHICGRIVDIFADDEGTFSPERAGAVPCIELVKLCYSGKFSQQEMVRQLKGSGGLAAYLGTNDAKEVERRIDAGDKTAEMVYSAMAYQIAKNIAALAAVANGQVDAIAITGGMAYSKRLISLIEPRVAFIAPVHVIPGTMEMEALAQGVSRVLRGEEHYSLFDVRDRR